MSSDLHCRVCGLVQSDPPWGEDGRSPTFEICACCGCEFGYEDCTPASAAKARAKWLAAGGGWWRPESCPPGWNREEQLKAVSSGTS